MGIGRAQVVPTDRQVGAQISDGSLLFEDAKGQVLTRTPSTSGDKNKFTISYWFKQCQPGVRGVIMSATNNGVGSNEDGIEIDGLPIRFYSYVGGAFRFQLTTNRWIRDNGWYHIVGVVDTAQGTAADRVKLYLNGEEQVGGMLATATYPSQNQDAGFFATTGIPQYIGGILTSHYWDGPLSQAYFIDGQALDPSYFGFTDSSTGIWRPKKYVNTTASIGDAAGVVGYGTCGFHLPFDGSAAPWKDQSGQGNDWTPVHLQSSVLMDKATGAFPILDTTGAGKVAMARVRGNVGVAVTVYDDGGGDKYYLDGVKTGNLGFVRGQTVTFDTSNSTVSGHPFRLSGVSNGAHAANYYSVDFDGTGDYLSVAESTDWLLEEGDFTIEFWAYIDAIATDGAFVTNMDNFDSSSQYNSRFVIGLYSSEVRVWLADDGAHVLHDYFPPQGEWVHYAVTRETGNSFSLYKNGIRIMQATQTCDLDTNGALQIGYLNNLGTYDGHISDLRLVKGTAVYTENFTPPVSPLTNITNTKLLCCNSSTTTGSTVTPTTITANGDPAASNDNPYDTYPFSTTTNISEGTAGAATTITIPQNAPENLYYYCTAHSGMGGSGTIGVSTDIQKADPYAWKNTLALPLIGNAKDNSNNVNTNIASKSVTVNNAVASYTQSNFYGGSYSFDGNGDYLSLSSTSDFDFDKGDFTIELWANCDSYSGSPYLFDFRADGSDTGTTNRVVWYVPSSSGKPTFWANGSSRIVADNTITLDAWTHLALVRENGTTTMYIDGSAQSSTYSDSIDYTTSPLTIGQRQGTSSQSWDGFLQDVRIYKGIAKYTSNFIPASTNPNVRLDSPSGSVYNSTLTKVNAGSVSFNGILDGSGDLIKIPYSSTYQWNTQAWTLEFWVYANAFSVGSNGNSTMTAYAASADGSEYWSFGAQADGTVEFYYWTGSQNRLTTTDAITLNRWNHLAFTHDGSNNLAIWINGEKSKTGTISGTPTTLTDNLHLRIGGHTTEYFDGIISNYRITHGQALYTSNFTPSRQPLTTTSQGAIASNVKVLCCNSTNSPAGFTTCPGTLPTIAATGSPSAGSGNQPAGAAGSIDFDGTNDYLTVTADCSLDKGDFTAEAWIYTDSASTNNQTIFCSPKYYSTSGGGSNGNWIIRRTNSSTIAWASYDIQSSEEYVEWTAATSESTWYHVAVVRDGTSSGAIQLYLNGTKCAVTSGTAISSKNLIDGATGIRIGEESVGGPGNTPWNGHISNARLTTNAVYSGNFVPSAPLALTPSTIFLACQSSSSTTEVFGSQIWAVDGAGSTPRNPFDSGTNFVGGQASGYATLNPLAYDQSDCSNEGEGNLKAQCGNQGTATKHPIGNIPVSYGKWYYETEWISTTDSSLWVGLANPNSGYRGGYLMNRWKYRGSGGEKNYYNGGIGMNEVNTLGDFSVGDIIGVAVDMDAGKWYVSANGQWQDCGFGVGDPVLGTGFVHDNLLTVGSPNLDGDIGIGTTANTGEVLPYWGTDGGSTTIEMRCNFGQLPFKSEPPEGYKPICLSNLTPPEIARPDKYVGVTTWSGNETAGRQIEVGFNPDLIMFKAVNDSTNWYFTDVVRGSNKFVYCPDQDQEATTANILNVDDNNVKGFKIGSSGVINGTSAYWYVSYAFKAGGDKNTFSVDDVGYASAAAANLGAGSLNSTVNASQTWSGLFTLASGSFDQAIANAFNGTISEGTRARTSGNGVLITMSLSSAVTVSSQIIVYGETRYNSTCTVTVGGTVYTSCEGWVHTFNVSGSLTQMTLTGNSSSGRTYMQGMVIDGKQLVDSNISYNKPSIAATGASVGTKQGFSIIKYTGTGSVGTIAHGLNKKPNFILVRNLDSTAGSLDFPVYATAGGSSGTGGAHGYLRLNSNVEWGDKASLWNDIEPDNEIITIGTDSDVNISGDDYIMYAWANVTGMQKFGCYRGTGDEDGSYIYLGFKPAILWIKRMTTGSTNDWIIYDKERDPDNTAHNRLVTSQKQGQNDTSSSSVNRIDRLSDGFKIRNTGDAWNNSASTYLYCAWAETAAYDMYGGQATGI